MITVAGESWPKLTSREAVQLVRAFSSARGRASFPLWYQFAAVAFAWNPSTDTLDTSTARGAKQYPAEATAELWRALHTLADEADAEQGHGAPSLYFDVDPWGDPLFAGDVRRALQGDGADAQFKIPLPACKDPKTGKPIGKPTRDPVTGKWKCEPVAVDDPVTHAGNQVVTLVLLGLAAWALFGNPPRRRRRS